MLEEVLTGETADGLPTLAARAADLVGDLGLEPAIDPALDLMADEMAGVVAKTLALPEIAAIRPRLVPELPVYGASDVAGVEHATFGIVDALCISNDGKPELVVDWKSDVSPSPAATDHYRAQVRRYLDVAGISRGLVVFVTSGKLVHVE